MSAKSDHLLLYRLSSLQTPAALSTGQSRAGIRRAQVSLPSAVVQRVSPAHREQQTLHASFPSTRSLVGTPVGDDSERGVHIWDQPASGFCRHVRLYQECCPVWVNLNWYLAQGVHDCGDIELAAWIEDSLVSLVDTHGFYEYYDPNTGKGLGAAAS